MNLKFDDFLFFNWFFVSTTHEYFEVLDIALFHIFQCFVPWKFIILNFTLFFELNYFYSSLKSLVILSLQPKKYFNSPKQEN